MIVIDLIDLLDRVLYILAEHGLTTIPGPFHHLI